MSDALAYLLKARPEAMGLYFAFLKDCGKHLDPKTRALISVITKVDAQTERGFRQYLGRALRDGCTPMEVLDALLMAFPTLGLSKIVWAVDIILALELPGFALEALHAGAGAGADADANGDAGADAGAGAGANRTTPMAIAAADSKASWHDLMATRGFKVGTTQRIDCDGHGLFVHRLASRQWRVYDSRCPHQGTDIPGLAVHDNTTLTCPKHAWAFDLRSGHCIRNGDTALKLWPNKPVKGRLLARW